MNKKNIIALFVTGAITLSPLAKDAKDNAVTLKWIIPASRNAGIRWIIPQREISSRKRRFRKNNGRPLRGFSRA